VPYHAGVPSGDPIRLAASESARDGLPSSERAYRGLRHQILIGRLSPGQRLVEMQLAAQFNVSRTPIREALKRLIAEGLVATNSRNALVVREFDETEVEDIYAIRESLDGLAARLAAERATEADLARLRLVMELMDESARAERSDSVVHLNIKFHELLYAAGQNNRLASIGGSLQDAVQRYSSMVFSDHDRVRAVLAEHEAIMAAIESGDADAAEQAARRHLAAARANLSRLFEAERRDQA
jgi:DNA-binding GntR family transcriptional regulator